MKFPAANLIPAAPYWYFHLAAKVLQRLVANDTAALSVDQLAHHLEANKADIAYVCKRFAVTGAIKQGARPGLWSLAISASDTTLEDVWRAVGGGVKEWCTGAYDCTYGSAYKVDLITIQAFLGIEQVIASHLRRFRLDAIDASRRQYGRRAAVPHDNLKVSAADACASPDNKGESPVNKWDMPSETHSWNREQSI